MFRVIVYCFFVILTMRELAIKKLYAGIFLGEMYELLVKVTITV